MLKFVASSVDRLYLLWRGMLSHPVQTQCKNIILKTRYILFVLFTFVPDKVSLTINLNLYLMYLKQTNKQKANWVDK